MKKEEFLKLQIGLYVTDHQDTSDPSNYCRITAFKGDRIQLQGYERHGVPVKAHPFWMSYRDLNRR